MNSKECYHFQVALFTFNSKSLIHYIRSEEHTSELQSQR